MTSALNSWALSRTKKDLRNSPADSQGQHGFNPACNDRIGGADPIMTAIIKDRRKTLHLSGVLVFVVIFNLLILLPYANRLFAACMEGNCDYGQGTYTFSDGSKCVGKFKDGKLNGQGTCTLPNGSKYVGEFKDDNFNGQGTYTFSDGSEYDGEFMDGKRAGRGTYTFSDGSKYIGEFTDGKINGQGTYTLPDGSKYVGEFKDGKINGQGEYTSADGSKCVGEFKDGKIDCPAAPGKRTESSRDGERL